MQITSITWKSQDHFHQITIWYVPFCSVVHSLPGWPLYPLPLEQLPWHHFQKGVSALIPVTPVSASFWPHFQLLTGGPHADCGSCHHTAELFRRGGKEEGERVFDHHWWTCLEHIEAHKRWGVGEENLIKTGSGWILSGCWEWQLFQNGSADPTIDNWALYTKHFFGKEGSVPLNLQDRRVVILSSYFSAYDMT